MIVFVLEMNKEFQPTNIQVNFYSPRIFVLTTEQKYLKLYACGPSLILVGYTLFEKPKLKKSSK